MPNPASIKATYRFLNNPKVKQNAILDAHKDKTVARSKIYKDRILSIQDTTYCNYNSRPKTQGIGTLSKNQHGDIKGFCIHHTLCVQDNDIPIGLIKQDIYNHKPTDKSKRNRPIEEKESYRWIEHLRTTKELTPDAITLCDREADFFDFLAEAKKIDADIIVRATSNTIHSNKL